MGRPFLLILTPPRPDPGLICGAETELDFSGSEDLELFVTEERRKKEIVHLSSAE